MRGRPVRIAHPKHGAAPLDAATIDHTIIDAMSQADRRYFELHPEAQVYKRPFVPGESPALPFTPALVQVNKLEPNLRSKFFLDSQGCIRLACLDFDGESRAELDRYTRIYSLMLNRLGVR